MPQTRIECRRTTGEASGISKLCRRVSDRLRLEKGRHVEASPFFVGTVFLYGVIPDDNNLLRKLDRQSGLPNQSWQILCPSQ